MSVSALSVLLCYWFCNINITKTTIVRTEGFYYEYSIFRALHLCRSWSLIGKWKIWTTQGQVERKSGKNQWIILWWFSRDEYRQSCAICRSTNKTMAQHKGHSLIWNELPTAAYQYTQTFLLSGAWNRSFRYSGSRLLRLENSHIVSLSAFWNVLSITE